MPDKTSKANCYLRKAEPDDENMLLEWANDKETRNNSFSSHEISPEEHRQWFFGVLNDPDRIQYIMMDGDTPVGQIRLDISDNEAEISYSIAPTHRRKGYGHIILGLIKEQALTDCPSITKLKGSVKTHNKESMKCFENNGFEEIYRVFEIKTVNVTSSGGV